jgi:MFS family permease
VTAGLAFLPMTLSIVAGATLASRLVGRVGARSLLVTGMLSLTVGLVLFARLPVHGSYWTTMFGPSLLVALGVGLSFTPAAISGVAGVSAHEAGLASGLVTAHTTAERHAGVGAHLALTDGFHLAFLISAGLSLAGAAAAARLPAVQRARASDRRHITVEA